jgi:replicative DNA helicase
VKRRRATEGLRLIARSIHEAEESRDDAALLELDSRMLELSRDVAREVPSSKVERFSQVRERQVDYRERAAKGLAFGIPLGLGKIDTYTLGLQPGEYASIVGWQGKGKSTLLQAALLEAWLSQTTSEQGLKGPILFFSLEMKARTVYRRFDTMLMNHRRKLDELVRYHGMKALEMTDAELDRWDKAAELIGQAEHDIIVIDDILHCTPDRVMAEVSSHNPSICAVDYITLMESPSRASMWESITMMTRQMKMIAQATDTPLYAVAQTNIASAAEGAMLENIAFARSIGADSDLVLGLHQTEDMRKRLQMIVRLLKNRDGAPTEQGMYWDPVHMYFRPLQPHDIFSAVRTQAEEDADAGVGD